MSFWTELRRRNVIRMVGLYLRWRVLALVTDNRNANPVAPALVLVMMIAVIVVRFRMMG